MITSSDIDLTDADISVAGVAGPAADLVLSEADLTLPGIGAKPTAPTPKPSTAPARDDPPDKPPVSTVAPASGGDEGRRDATPAPVCPLDSDLGREAQARRITESIVGWHQEKGLLVPGAADEIARIWRQRGARHPVGAAFEVLQELQAPNGRFRSAAPQPVVTVRDIAEMIGGGALSPDVEAEVIERASSRPGAPAQVASGIVRDFLDGKLSVRPARSSHPAKPLVSAEDEDRIRTQIGL